MKRIIQLIFLILLTYFIFPTIALAATNLDTDNQRPVVGSTIEVRLRVDYGIDVLVGEAHYYVKYDPTKLEVDQIRWTQSSGTYNVNNGTIEIDKTADTEAWEYGSPIVIVFKTLSEGTSKILVEEKAPGKYKDGNVIAQYYSGITINAVAPSTATRIGKLQVEGYKLSPTFNPEKTEYTVTVPSNVTKVNVTASKGEKNQTITGTGTRILEYGPNKVRVVVTAQNGASATYLITINRDDDRSKDVTLKTLNISNTDIKYEKGKTEYEAIVSKSVDNIFIAAQTTEPRAQLVGTGQKTLEMGENIFHLTVTSRDGINETYTIKIIRSEEEFKPNEESTLLESLTINGITIKLNDEKFDYVTSVDEDITELDIALFTKSTTATYEITGNELKKGFNTIKILVEDNELPPTEYYITVYRQPSITKKYTSFEEILAEEKLEEHIYFETTDNTKKIPKEVLKKINENKIDFYYTYVNEERTIIYQLIIPTGTFTDEINPKLDMEIENPLTYVGSIPKGIRFMVYLGNIYGTNAEVQAYTYDEVGFYTDLTTSLKVVDGYVNVTTNGQKAYVFSNQVLTNNNGFDLLSNLPMIIFGLLIVFLFAFIIIKKKKSKKVEKTNEPLY